MIDFHCHLDLYPNASDVVRECGTRKLYVLSVTTTPSAWKGTTALADGISTVRTAIGLHPQIAAEREHELPLFDSAVLETRYVGEVGLDGSEEFESTWDAQIRVFSHVLSRCGDVGGRIISIHSRRATSDVLDMLGNQSGYGIPILHWFSGTHAELHRAVRLGCWFSVGPAMLRSRKGQALVAKMPVERVLTETDGPFARLNERSLLPWDVTISTRQLAGIWGQTEAEVNQRLLRNLRSLTSLPVA